MSEDIWEVPMGEGVSFEVIYWKGLQLKVPKALPVDAYVALEAGMIFQFLKLSLGEEQWGLLGTVEASLEEMQDLGVRMGTTIMGLNKDTLP